MHYHAVIFTFVSKLIKGTMNSPVLSSTRFTPLQHEMLRLYSMDLPETDLIEIKDMIGTYLLNKLQQDVDSAVEQNNLTNADFEKWLNEKS